MIPSLLLLSLLGCAFDEGLPEIDIQGKVVIPREAATREVLDENGDLQEVTDVRLLGPVYLGAFADVGTDYFDYPHPEMGPIIDTSKPGNTYPYGGTSVGRFDFACFESVACQVTTGRFSSFDEILEYFNVWADDPVVDAFSQEITSPDYYEQYCIDYFHITRLQELAFLAIDDEGNPAPDFTENADGDFEAEFEMHRVTWVEGMKLWGWIDSPSEAFTFSTCEDSYNGQAIDEYNQDINAGAGNYDVLNYPSSYIFEGDWVVSEAWAMETQDDEPTLRIDFHYE